MTTATQAAKARMPDLDSGRRRRAALTFISRYGTIIGLLAMIVFFAINAPGTFLSRANLLNILSQASLTAIISAGLTFTLVVGEFDLSIGNVASFIGLVVVGLMAKERLPLAVSVPLALLVGVFIGLVNGFLVTKVRINAVIATIGVGTMLTGLGFSYSAFPIAIGIPRAFTEISLGRALFGVPNPVFVMAALLIVMWTILNKTDLGQRMQAVGSNIEAARLSGIRVDRTKMFAFATAGFCAALTGVLLTSLLGSGTLAAADGYLLDAFAAVFLGSATLREGQFHIAGTLIGVLILAVGFNGLSIFGRADLLPADFQGRRAGSRCRPVVAGSPIRFGGLISTRIATSSSLASAMIADPRRPIPSRETNETNQSFDLGRGRRPHRRRPSVRVNKLRPITRSAQEASMKQSISLRIALCAAMAGAVAGCQTESRNIPVMTMQQANQLPASQVPRIFRDPSNPYGYPYNVHETDGLSRNPDDCIRWGCVDTGGNK